MARSRCEVDVKLLGISLMCLYLVCWAYGLLHWLWVEAFGAAYVAALAETGDRWQR